MTKLLVQFLVQDEQLSSVYRSPNIYLGDKINFYGHLMFKLLRALQKVCSVAHWNIIVKIS